MAQASRRVFAEAILRMKSGSVLKGLFSWGLVLGLVVLIQEFQSADLVQGNIPNPSEPVLNGQIPSKTLKSGQVRVLYVWGSWCGICRLMQKTVSALAEEYPLMTVAMNSGGAAQVLEYERVHDFNLPTVLDEEGHYASSLGVRNVPALFVLSPDGKVLWKTVGFTTYWGVKLRILLLAEPLGSSH
jgi:thiol-disulfide isomerase/thioredoxin